MFGWRQWLAGLAGWLAARAFRLPLLINATLFYSLKGHTSHTSNSAMIPGFIFNVNVSYLMYMQQVFKVYLLVVKKQVWCVVRIICRYLCKVIMFLLPEIERNLVAVNSEDDLRLKISVHCNLLYLHAR